MLGSRDPVPDELDGSANIDTGWRRRGGRRSRIVRAILAGGIVLGFGATSTLAVWNDSEVVSGSFGASTFAIESQTRGADYASHSSAPGTVLDFAATAMSPGLSRYAWINIRTTLTTTVRGSVQLSGVTSDSGGLVGALQYRVVQLANPAATETCDATVFSGSPGYTYTVGGASNYVPITQVSEPPGETTLETAGTVVRYCFEVRVAPGVPDSFQGKTARVTWQFTGTSQ